MVDKYTPSYLRDWETNGHVYGTLRYSKSSRLWLIEGEPAVIQMAKRLFPGSAGRGRVVKFPANKRSTGELNWLMQRFRLEILSPEAWEELRQEAIDHVLKREEINRRPLATVPPATFKELLSEYQKEGLGWMLHNERTLLADETGLGKTPQALAWLASLEAFPSIIVVQPHMLLQWKGEIHRFLDLPSSYTLGDQTTMFEDEASKVHIIQGLRPYDLPPASVYLIHYLLLRGWKDVLPEYGFKAVVFDEIQELRHRGTEKYSAASMLAESVEYVVGLSGTPIYNRGGEIWNVMNIVEYHSLGDWDSFSREWCDGYGSDYVRDSKMLGEYLRREGLLLRRLKEDVMGELPEKRRFVQTIDLDRGLYDSLIEEAVNFAIEADKATRPWTRGRLESHAINETRRVTGLAKAKYVAAFVKTLLDAGEPVLLFAYHHDVWDVYKELLKDYNPFMITGKENPKEKHEAQQKFVNGKTNLLFMSLRSATGLNLQRENAVVVFGELDWSPAVHKQAEDRVHRREQKTSVLCYYLVCDEGTDAEMLDAIGLKVEQFTGIMGDKPETEEDRALAQVKVQKHMQNVIQKLKKRHARKRSRTS